MGIRHSKKSVDIHTAVAKKDDLTSTAEVKVTELSPDCENAKPAVEDSSRDSEKTEEPVINGDAVTPTVETKLEDAAETIVENASDDTKCHNDASNEDKPEEKREKVKKKKKSFRSFSFLRREKKVKQENTNGDIKKEKEPEAKSEEKPELKEEVSVIETTPEESKETPATESSDSIPLQPEPKEEPQPVESLEEKKARIIEAVEKTESQETEASAEPEQKPDVKESESLKDVEESIPVPASDEKTEASQKSSAEVESTSSPHLSTETEAELAPPETKQSPELEVQTRISEAAVEKPEETIMKEE